MHADFGMNHTDYTMTETCSLRRLLKHTTWVVAGMLALAGPNASASIFVTNLDRPGDPLPIVGNQGWGGQLGDDFTTTASIIISRIGVFDSEGNGTTTPLTWQLFDVTTGALLLQVLVPASGPLTPGPSIIESNYVFLDLLAPLVLPANGVYSAVASGFNDANPNFNTNFDLVNLDVDFSTTDLIAAGGRFSGSPALTLPSADAGNTASANRYNFGAATFVYESVPGAVPEAGSIAMWSIFATCSGVLLWRRRGVA